jgi:hypothetical protein
METDRPVVIAIGKVYEAAYIVVIVSDLAYIVQALLP